MYLQTAPTVQTVLQVEDIRQVENLLPSRCSEIRVGSEFCENKIPSLPDLIPVLEMIEKAGKKFSVIYPRLSNRKMAEVAEHLEQLNRHCDSIDIVANDLGILNRVRKEKLTHLNLYLGRQLISLPGRARPPMPKIMGKENLLSKFADKQLFHKTNFNYSLTLEFLKQNGIRGIEIDFIPETFPQLEIFARSNLEINIHTASVLVSLTRKCHTARYFQKDIAACGRQCYRHLLQVSDNRIGTLYLYGNTLLDYPAVRPGDFNGLKIKSKTRDKYKLVIGINRLNRLDQVEAIDGRIDFLKGVYHDRR